MHRTPSVAVCATGAPSRTSCAGWPQTIAITDDPPTNFGLDLRAFVAIIATSHDTHVTVSHDRARHCRRPFATASPRTGAARRSSSNSNPESGNRRLQRRLHRTRSSTPIDRSSCSRAARRPTPRSTRRSPTATAAPTTSSTRTPPLRTVGKSYVLAKMPNRTAAVIAAGADIGEIIEIEYYRVVAAATGTIAFTTTLPSPWNAFDLNGRATPRRSPPRPTSPERDQPAIVLGAVGSARGGVPDGYPGGDPSRCSNGPQ